MAKPFLAVSAALVREIVVRAGPRDKLNSLYRRLPPRRRIQFHRHFAKLFRDRDTLDVKPGVWIIDFANRQVAMPLTPERMWLDWDLALTINCHDFEIKETYVALLSNVDPPTTFIDVGANYGTHSLIFLVHGIKTITFEPNPNCHSYFLETCKLNGVVPQIEGVAVGNSHDPLRLSFPERETWLGSMIGRDLAGRDDLIHLQVAQRRLDDLSDQLEGERVLIKIDAEGFEEHVILGAQQIIKSRRTVIIFETNDRKQRGDLFKLLLSNSYGIAPLPWNGRDQPRLMSVDEFRQHPDNNFLAYALPGFVGPPSLDR